MNKKVKMFLLILFLISFIVQAQTTKPYQFIAKIYTEALGVTPDPVAWAYNQNAMDNATDVKQWMKYQGLNFFTDAVYFLPKYPITTHKASRLLALFRGAFNREPAFYEFNYYLSQITNENSWTTLVTQFFNSTESNTLLDNAITRANQGKPYYGWGNNPVISIITNYPVIGDLPSNGTIITGTTLQTALNNAANNPTNKTVLLSQMAVVCLDAPLNIPQGVTLATVGYPTRVEYAKMARIVWDPNKSVTNHMIMMNSQSKLLSVWVDGQVGQYPQRIPKNGYSTIWVQGDRSYNSVQITDNRISDSHGVRSIWMGGHYYNEVCSNNIVSFNLLTGYANDHLINFSDGMDISCEGIRVWGNEIVDITDVAIGIFRSEPDFDNHERSRIEGNKILNAGNSSTGGVAIDPGSTEYAHGSTVFDFSGVNIWENIIWTSNSAHTDVAIQVGCRWMYYHSQFYQYYPVLADGGTSKINIYNNTSSGNLLNTNISILIDGAKNTNIYNNTLNVNIETYHSRPTGILVKNSDDYWSSGNNDPESYEPYETSILDCWGHTGGIYIKGVNTAAYNGTYTFTAVNMGDYLINTYHWQLTDYINPNIVLANFYTNPININFSNFYSSSSEKFRLRLNVGPINWSYDAWKEKYIKNSNFYTNNSLYNTKNNHVLKQNYPNPFNPTTKITYFLKGKGLIKLEVYNTLGQRVAELVNSLQEAGFHTVTFDGSKLPSGVYFYQLISDNYKEIKKLLLLK